jgi:hypothetical protein
VIFRPFYYYDLGCASYLLGCGTLGTCAVVDPRADDVDAYVAFARAKKMRISQVIDTHVHADHRSGGVELARQTGAAYRLHEAADVQLPFKARRGIQRVNGGIVGARAGELHPHGIVGFVVVERLQTEPQAIWRTRDRRKGHVHVMHRRCKRCTGMRDPVVGCRELDAAGRSAVGRFRPRAVQIGRSDVAGIEDDLVRL